MTRTMTALALLALTPAAVSAEQTVDKSRSSSRDGVVQINNVAGSLDIVGWDRDQVHVSGTMGDDVEELRFESSGERTIIEVVLPKRGNVRDGGAELKIQVPRGSRVEAETVSADIDTQHLRGGLSLATVSGDIDVSGESPSIRGASVSGDISIKGSSMETDAKSVSGDVKIAGISGVLQASAVSGDISVRGERLRSAEMKTTSGDVTFSGDLTRDATLRAESVSGDIRLVLPKRISADFEASTFSGEIRNAFGPGAERTSKYVPSKELSFTEGAGGATIRVRSFSGTVHIERA